MMIIFPPSIVNEDINRPVIVFKQESDRARTADHIVLPIPQAIQFSDSAAYNNQELGFTGAAILNAGTSSSVSNAASDVFSQAKNSLPANMAALAQFISTKTLGRENQAAVGIATATTLNKNIVTEFTGVSTRQFGFQFKLIATSREESNLIKKIIDIFREGVYPEGNSLQLKYPPIWYIDFKKGGSNIEHIPKIFPSYLTTLSTSYNASMNLFHDDGSPVEIDVQLTFMESRALTLADIKALKEKAAKEGDNSFKRAFSITDDITKAAKRADELAAAEAGRTNKS